LVGRIAKSGVQRFWGHVEARLRADEANPFAGLLPVQEAFARLLPLSEPVLLGAFRRWIEHEIAQAIAIEAEVASGGASLPGAVTVAFLFCDLTGFTALADAEGDAAAAEVADSFARIVAEQRGEFLLMKSLGDGAMLVYPEGIAAVSAGARIIEQTRLGSPLRVHAGAHVGAAIARDGDYYGSSVNLAARLLGVAQPDQLIATREVVDRTAVLYNWEPLGSREIRGIGQPVDVFCLSSRGDASTDQHRSP
jgi:adenylate cyclase